MLDLPRETKKKRGGKRMKLLIFIPAFNEAGSITAVVDELKRVVPDCDYIVVNDGSEDDTAAICHENQYPLLDLPVNIGLTKAFQTAVLYAYEKSYDAIIQIDGDGQHDPGYIQAMSEIMEKQKADLVIGSRFMEKPRPLMLRSFGNKLLNIAIHLTTGKAITDSTSGMRMYGKRLLDIMYADINSTPEPDTVAYLLMCGAKIEECPVTMRERTTGKSYLGSWRSITYMIHMILSICFVQRLRKRRKL